MTALPAVGLQQIPGDLFTNGLAVALIALLHVQIATYITGGSTLAVVSEAISMARGDDRHERLAHGLVKSFAYVFSFGSALAIFWVMFILLGLWGRFFVALERITFWMFVLEAFAFLVEIALLYTLYANWDRLRPYRRARLGLLVLFTVVDWWQMFFINVIASYMLTPNAGDTDQLGQILNPVFLPLQLHRTVGNIAWSGAALCFFAGIRYLRATRARRDEREPRLVPARSVGAMAVEPVEEGDGGADGETESAAAYWDWAGQWGLMWAVGLSLFQIWIGYALAKEVQLHAYASWYRMMFGALSTVFLVQIFLLGAIFTLGAYYFWRRMRASGIVRLGVQRACFVLLVLSTLLAVQPAFFALDEGSVTAAHLDRPWWDGGLNNPIGNFIPNKVIALTVMMICGLVSLTSYLRAYSAGRVRSGTAPRHLQATLIAVGVAVSLMMAVMGVIRENSRQPYLINGELRISHQELTGGAIGLPGPAHG